MNLKRIGLLSVPEKHFNRFTYVVARMSVKVTYVGKVWIRYSCFEKGCRKKSTRQTRKVLWVVLSSLFFKEI